MWKSKNGRKGNYFFGGSGTFKDPQTRGFLNH